MDYKEIKIIGPNKNKIRFSENLPVVSFQLSCQPPVPWVKIFDRVCRTTIHSKKPRVTVTGDFVEFILAGDNNDLQLILDFIKKDIGQANLEYQSLLAEEQQQIINAQKKKESMVQDIKNSLDGLKYD